MKRQVVLYLVACLYVYQRACIAKPVGDGDANGAKADDNDVDYIKYLIRYNYIKEAKPGEPVSYRHIDDVSEALREFQHMASIPETGVFDDATKTMMKMPRCGNPDKPKYSKSGHREKRYLILGSPWERNDLTYAITGYTKSLSRSSVRREIKRAFDVWSEVTPLRFTRHKSLPADIEIYFASGDHGDGDPFDGRGNNLAHASSPYYGGDIHFDESERWTIRLKSGTNLFQVAAHEIGHSLGLDHSAVKSALMSEYYRGYVSNFKLHSDDIAGIQSLYGPPLTDTATKRPTANPREDDHFDICAEGRFDAIATIDGHQYGFVGDYYVRLTSYGIASGYPKKITDYWSRLPTPLDAVVQVDGVAKYKKKPARALFFKGDKVWSYIGKNLQSGYPKRISKEFRGLPNNIDSAFVWSRNNKLYFTKGSRYYRYTRNNAIDRRYPRSLSKWRGLPSSVDAAFQDENKVTYFFKGKDYYRFDDDHFAVAHASPQYPRYIDIWWLACTDDSLNDLTNAETEMTELETKRKTDETDVKNRLSLGLNETANTENEVTQVPERAKENVTQGPESAEGEVTQGSESADDEVTHGPESAEDEVTQGSKSTKGGVTQGPKNAEGEVTQGFESAKSDATQGSESAEGGVTQGLESAKGGVTQSPESAEDEVTQGSESAKGEVTQGSESAEGGVTHGPESAKGGVTHGLESAKGEVTQGSESAEGGVTQGPESAEGGVTHDPESAEDGVADGSESAEDDVTQSPGNSEDKRPENGANGLVHHVITYVIVAIGVAVRTVVSWH